MLGMLLYVKGNISVDVIYFVYLITSCKLKHEVQHNVALYMQLSVSFILNGLLLTRVWQLWLLDQSYPLFLSFPEVC